MSYSLANLANLHFLFSLVEFSSCIMHIGISGLVSSFLLRKENFIVLALVSSLKHANLFPDCFKLWAKLGFPEVPRKRLLKQHPLYKMRHAGRRTRTRSGKTNCLQGRLTSVFLAGRTPRRIRQTYVAKCNKWIPDDNLFSSSLILLKIDLKYM